MRIQYTKSGFRRSHLLWAMFGMVIVLTWQFAFAETVVKRINPFREHVAIGNSSVEMKPAIARANELSDAFRSASKQVLPSLVAIETRVDISRALSNDGNSNRNPFSQQSPDYETGMGSGVIVDSSGIILTNNHVVAGGVGEVKVRLNDGREFAAVQVLTDPKTDIAIVRIQGAENLIAAPLGDSNAAEIGDWVLALGQPFGLESTVTAGIVSAKQRGIGINEREAYIQTDAAINPGNSGGPLVNLNGEVVGINTAISSRSGGNEGIGFAIPINLARWVGGQLIDRGTVQRSFIGVGVQELDATIAKQFGVQPRSGVLITLVQPGSPAAKAGLKTGDVLLSFDEQPLRDPSQLQLAVERCEPGVRKQLKILRGSEQLEMSVTPAQIPDEIPVAAQIVPAEKDAKLSSQLGIRVEALQADVAQQLGLTDIDGVVITAVARGSAAEQAGLIPGIVITEINRQPIHNMQDFASAMQQADPVRGILLLVKAGAATRFVVLQTMR
jgi:serine protease Do